MPDSQVSLQPDGYYHIYNHAVGRENLFEKDDDYTYFLKKLKEHVLPISDILSYCLLLNHFHLVVRIKDHSAITTLLKQKSGISQFERENKKRDDYVGEQISKIFSNLFNTYAKHYNFVMNRSGTLFKRNFRRNRIEDMAYLRRLICYVHQNPVAAGFCRQMQHWKYSSFNAILSSGSTMIPRDEIIELFGDLENLKYCHLKMEELEIG
jgi:REP element-mobilizing transposase RayT